MCDYSLHGVHSRPAKVNDRLVTTQFRNTITSGFSEIGKSHVAVCLLPGTEICFDQEVERGRSPRGIVQRGRASQALGGLD